ncbi:hypothetical protein [Halobacillus litoralis]|uniref:hypothetical protein n=1 Tax=Halobacillus litoralis TaxID=45668 RepID=UPI001CFCE560|nr:hypothetical protein [Halobacillus litoralis]
MTARNLLAITTLVALIFISACSGDKEQKEGNEKPEAFETEKTLENMAHEDDVKKEESSKSAGSEKNNGEAIENMQSSKVVIPDEYEKYAETLNNFELPQEGRLSDEEAEEKLGMTRERKSGKVIYSNGMIFNEKTKELTSQVWLNEQRPYPHGSQVLGFFRTIIHSCVSDVEIANHSNIDIYSTDAEAGRGGVSNSGILASGTLPLDILSERDRQFFGENNGWSQVLSRTDYLLKQLRQFEVYLDDEGYDHLASWTTETNDLFEKAYATEQSNWEEGYRSFHKGMKRVKMMEYAISN